MTTQHSNRIIMISERNAMFIDGISNAELRVLLNGVDKQGVPAIDRGRIQELIASLESSDTWPLGWTKTEEGFDRAQAVQDLKQELARREQGVDGNAEHVGRYVAALNQYHTGSGRYLEGFPYHNADLRAYLEDVLSGKSNPTAETPQTTPNLTTEALKALNCEYAQQVLAMSVNDHQCPAQPRIPFGYAHQMPVSGRML